MAEVDDVGWLVDARVVADDLVRLFGDDERGGFFTTGVDAEELIVRPKDVQDNATPAASSMAASALLRLAALTGDDAPAELGHRWALALAPVAADHAPAFAYLLGAFERATSPSLEVAVIGDPDDDATPRSGARCRVGCCRRRCRSRARATSVLASSRRCSMGGSSSTVGRRRSCASGTRAACR